MKNIFISLLVILGSVTANALPVSVERRDMKLATQQMVEKQTFTNPVATDANRILTINAGPTSAAAASTTTFLAQPDVPRVLSVTPGGKAAVGNCNVLITGTDYLSNSITETFYIGALRETAYTGVIAFKTVTQVDWPANCETGSFNASWSVGVGEALGLKRCTDSPGHFLFSTLNGAKEGTAPTMTSGTSNGINTVDFNGTMNGANDFEFFFFQNFTCF